ncbi:MAG: hypothetical protein VX000_15355 [Myxococcota bacterium]|nr:hypothetical protein [Myxococcota bacterium]
MQSDAQLTWIETHGVGPTEPDHEVPPALVPDGYEAGALLGKGSQSRV